MPPKEKQFTEYDYADHTVRLRGFIQMLCEKKILDMENL